MNGRSVEIRRGGDAALIEEREIVRECLDGARHAIAARTPQLDEIVGRGESDDQASVVAQDAPEFARVHPCCDRQDDGERAVGVRHEAVGISIASAGRDRIGR